MRLIVISTPEPIQHEGDLIACLLSLDLFALHLRKPHSTEDEMRRLIDSIPSEYHSRIVLHDHFALAATYGLKGVHLNRRNPVAPPGHHGSLSCSTHSLDELEAALPRVDYAFLSPIFDSISKTHYPSAFTTTDLIAAKDRHLLGPRVFALGGVSADRLDTVQSLGFGGAAMLGDVWQHAGTTRFNSYLDHLQQWTEER